MKRILTLIFVLITVTSCTREEIVQVQEQNNFFAAQSFERTTDLVAPFFESTFEIPLNIELLETDMVLVYHLVGIDNQGFDIWRLMPDTVYTNDGQEFQYNFEHNFDFVTVFIEGPSTFNFNSLLPGDTLDQTFRIVILPVDFFNSGIVDITNMSDVMQYVQ